MIVDYICIDISYAQQELQDLFPGAHLAIGDPLYICPQVATVRDLLWETYIDRYKAQLSTFDCNSFSAILRAFVRQWQYVKKLPCPWAVAEVWTKSLGPGQPAHAKNLIRTVDGWYWIEPQNDRIERATRNENINLIIM